MIRQLRGLSGSYSREGPFYPISSSITFVVRDFCHVGSKVLRRIEPIARGQCEHDPSDHETLQLI